MFMRNVMVPRVSGVMYESVAGMHEMGELPSPVVRMSAMDIAMERKPPNSTTRRRITLGMVLLKKANQRSDGLMIVPFGMHCV